MKARTHADLRQLRRARRQTGSIMVLTLSLAGVLAMALGVMLYNVSNLARSTNDKIAYEEAYHVAVGGCNMAKAWLMNPALAKQHLGAELGTQFEAVTTGGLAFSRFVHDNNTNAAFLNSMTSDDIMSYYTSVYTPDGVAPLTSGRSLEDAADRKVILEVGEEDGNKAICFENDVLSTPTGTMFLTGGTAPRSYVDRIKITTPYRGQGVAATGSFAPDDVRYVTVIIEAQGIAIGASGVTKKRTVQEKILIVPFVVSQPVAQSGAAIVGGGALTVQGSSHMNVYWGAVWGKSSLQLLNLSYSPATRTLNAAAKYDGAGLLDGQGRLDKWVRWQAAGQLINENNNPIFPSSAIFSVNAGTTTYYPVTDFFAQLMNNTFSSAGLNQTSLLMTGDYTMNLNAAGAIGGNAATEEESPGFGVYLDGMPYGAPNYQLGNGGLVQNMASVGAKVDAVSSGTVGLGGYTTWKNYAIMNNGYMRPNSDASQWFNNSGLRLYITTDTHGNNVLTTTPNGTPLSDPFSQLNMASLVGTTPTGNNGGHLTWDLPDRILFIDSSTGQYNGPMPDLPGQDYYVPGSNFFWKGMLYVNGNFDTGGAGSSPTVLLKNPDDYNTDPTGLSTGVGVSNCYLDGMLIVTGDFNRQGNSALYGAVVCKSTADAGGSPYIYYNTRTSNPGLFAASSGGLPRRTISGPIIEINTYM